MVSPPSLRRRVSAVRETRRHRGRSPAGALPSWKPSQRPYLRRWRSPVHVTEIHHFPDSRIADIFYQLAVSESLELHVAGEAQVRAIEPCQLGQEKLESADSFDELVIDNRFRAPVAHPIPFRPVLIFVDNDVRDRFAAFRIHVLVFKVEADLAAIVCNDLPPLGQHEDWQL